MTAKTDIQYRWDELARFAAAFQPNKVSLHPDAQDAKGLSDDIRLLARKVDALILAYGVEAERNGIISAKDCRECFADVLTNAIDGNATFCLESFEPETNERSDYDQHNTMHRAYQGV